MAGRRIAATAVGLSFTWCTAAPAFASAQVPGGFVHAATAVPAMMMFAKKKKAPAAEAPAGPALTPDAAEAKLQGDPVTALRARRSRATSRPWPTACRAARRNSAIP
ncbi:MAG: hypothetical protein U0168_25255 [Nannocystaceae bacterium]